MLREVMPSMADKRIAAVVVTYNRLPPLQKCIESLSGQTADCDILVVDNASADGTADYLARRSGKKPTSVWACRPFAALLETAWRAWFSIKENGLRYFVYRMIKPR